jgi:hypothetical protein
MEVVDLLYAKTHYFDLSNTSYFPPYSTVDHFTLSQEDISVLDELFYKHGIKAAGRRLGRCM